MLLDEVIINLTSGKGGRGVVRWLHEKGKEFSGPSGGNGGKGGDVYIKAVRDIGALSRFRAEKKFEAGRGAEGGSFGMHGKDGEDLIINVPLGSIVTNLDTGKVYEFLTEGEILMVLPGGRGGKGNKNFKSATNTRPTEFTLGKNGHEADFKIELRLIADAGFIGLPNAGKTSLLNALTNSKARVADYPFTTLEPNLGSLYGLILADIPGLIEGASEGKGIGDKFLKHISRTSLVIHCIALDSEDILKDYKVIRQELKDYDPILCEKEEIVVLTKTDKVSSKEVEKAVKILSKKNKNILEVSVLDDDSIKKLSDFLSKKISKKI
jgi:GTP-binding protein